MATAIEQRLQRLETHLEQENPVLLQVVRCYRQLDAVARRLGLLDATESYATRVPWWPLVSVLGTFSSGKSTFINHYLGLSLQLTGNQAVDDRFTVICYGAEETPRVLPGLALDADPRFPFYQISRDIERVVAGEGRRLDAYLQLKTCRSEKLQGKIVIDSPGFDADGQRTSVLKITDHILDLSDLVLVFFDARHPEPGAMQDTLEHLVANTITRADSSKFLYILNQIDNTAREDNPEEVFAAWQRALAQKGLTAGRFYRIYDPEAAVPIVDPALRERFEAKRAQDVAEIYSRINQVEVERAYRIIGVLEKSAKAIEGDLVPRLRELRERWRQRVLWLDGLLLGGLAALAAGLATGVPMVRDALARVIEHPIAAWLMAGLAALVVLYVHFTARRLAANSVAAQVRRSESGAADRASLERAFIHNTAWWRSLARGAPAGWGGRAKRQLARVLAEADSFVQSLNDRFTDPSGNANLAVRGFEESARGAPDASPGAAPPPPDAGSPAPDAPGGDVAGTDAGDRPPAGPRVEHIAGRR